MNIMEEIFEIRCRINKTNQYMLYSYSTFSVW